jgi:hypothetical protein
MKKDNQKVIQSQDRFALSDSPDAYVISLHIRNMMATFGEEYVRDVIRTLFLGEESVKTTRKKAYGEF